MSIITVPPNKVIGYILKNRLNTPILFGIIFIINGYVRNLFYPAEIAFNNYIFSSLISLLCFIAIAVIKNAYPQALEPIRWLTLVVLGYSLGKGIPFLYSNPEISRLTIGKTGSFDLELYAKGIGTYGTYTGLAIAWPAIAHWLYQSPTKLIIKAPALAALASISIATLLSTYTMASIYLILSILVWLSLLIIERRNIAIRGVALVILLVLVFMMPTFYQYALEDPTLSFSISKATRLVEGIQEEGLIRGDETNRVEMFNQTVDTFKESPFIGSWGISPNFFVGWHSSWADSLALFGVFGTVPWLIFLATSWRRKQPLSLSAGSGGGTIAWLWCLTGGILNPTLFSVITLLLLWLYDGYDCPRHCQ